MASLGSILSIASSAIRTHQQSIDVTAHNIANATTDGYSRQVPVLSQLPPVRLAQGIFGSGVKIDDIARVRDAYMDRSFRRETSSAAGFRSRAGLLTQVETLLREPSDRGLGFGMDALFTAFSDLAANPGDLPSRTVVREAGRSLAAHFNALNADLDDLRDATEDQLTASVDRINELATQIAALNEKVVATEVGGGTSGDLRDARDRAVDELSTLIPIQVVERTNGRVGVIAAGSTLVDGAHFNTLDVRVSMGTISMGVVGNPSSLSRPGAATGGLLTFLNTDLPAMQTGLDDLARALVEEINLLHQAGTNPDGNSGIDFFDPTGLDANSIALSADVLAGATAIAAGAGDLLGTYLAGANDVALAISGLRDTSLPTLGETPGGALSNLVVGLGSTLRTVEHNAEAHESLSDQADSRRISYSGVSTDEELVKLIQFQTAYQAAARVITVADEMIDSLINM